MKNKIADRLISVKSIVTIALTIVFSYLSITGVVDGNEFLTVFTVVISFYFGTQSGKMANEKTGQNTESEENANELQ